MLSISLSQSVLSISLSQSVLCGCRYFKSHPDWKPLSCAPAIKKSIVKPPPVSSKPVLLRKPPAANPYAKPTANPYAKAYCKSRDVPSNAISTARTARNGEQIKGGKELACMHCGLVVSVFASGPAGLSRHERLCPRKPGNVICKNSRIFGHAKQMVP